MSLHNSNRFDYFDMDTLAFFYYIFSTSIYGKLVLQLYVTFSLFQIVGFLTGILVGVPTAAYITYNLMDDETPKTPFLENISRKKAARPAIIVQEELKRVYVSHIFKYFGGYGVL